jgi:hypothetical protein
MESFDQCWHESKGAAIAAGRQPSAALLGPDAWEAFRKLLDSHACMPPNYVLHEGSTYEFIPCYRMDTPGVAIITSPPPDP